MVILLLIFPLLYLPQLTTKDMSYEMQITYKSLETIHFPHQSSFIPSVTRLFNDLPPNVKEAPSIPAFKYRLNKSMPIPITPKYYLWGKRKTQIWHARLRTNCSSLSYDLHCKNIVDSPNCICGERETAYHFFFVCNRFNHIRPQMLEEISRICTPSLDIMLFGNQNLNFNTNVLIFSYVHQFIEQSKRF